MPNNPNNKLASEKSLYLRQHANNPVNWQTWNEDAFALARKLDKPIILSSGYSSCHWCHVMEHECFESKEVAKVMNAHFISIKLDREERPDVDQIYMDALHAMGLQGGWPMNVFLTPDLKPFYGGTYFPKAHWLNLLKGVNEAYHENRSKLYESAEEFTKAINQSQNLVGKEGEILPESILIYFKALENHFDEMNGGFGSRPKFPMPSSLQSLSRVSYLFDEPKALEHLERTLEKMARGGIYDQIGGGFTRYSTDSYWLVPHFEKMLYDNGQLIGLYAEAFAQTKNKLYQKVVNESINYLKREMQDSNGGFYASQDADSEGGEGAFYIWDWSELKKLLGSELENASKLFGFRKDGNWEGKNIPIYPEGYQFSEKEAQLRDLIFQARKKRNAPVTDKKIITAWNGLAITGLSKAFLYTRNEEAKYLALKALSFIKNEMWNGEVLLHSSSGNKEGFLDDYLSISEASYWAYKCSGNQELLSFGYTLLTKSIELFSDAHEGELFFYTQGEARDLIARKKEIFDNVIPSTNSWLAQVLVEYGLLFGNQELIRRSLKICQKMTEFLNRDPRYLGQWATSMMFHLGITKEVAIIGKEAEEVMKDLSYSFQPFTVWAYSRKETSLPTLMQGRTQLEKTSIHICKNFSCDLPITDVELAKKDLNKTSKIT